jgi:hypothetical protein
MSMKLLIPLCAATALLAGCGPRDVPKSESETPAATAPDDAATGTPGDTSSTPGGTAGEMTPAPDTSTNPATPPPAEPAPAEQSPTTPPQ